MLTIKNIRSIIGMKTGPSNEWELIDVDDDYFDDKYRFQFKRDLSGTSGEYQQIVLTRIGTCNTAVDKIVYEFGEGLYTSGFLSNKQNVMDVCEQFLKRN